jgi:hypothetical protein
MDIKHKNLTDQESGKLVAVKTVNQSDDFYIWWECVCVCGNVKIVREDMFINKQVISCDQCNKGKNVKYRNIKEKRNGKISIIKLSIHMKKALLIINKYGNVYQSDKDKRYIKFYPENSVEFITLQTFNSLLTRRLIINDVDNGYKLTEKGIKAVSQIIK